MLSVKMTECPKSDVAIAMLEGLTVSESIEFHILDATTPYGGLHVWPTGELPHFASEERWLALWHKHQAALSGD
jgi:hypothetical protein